MAIFYRITFRTYCHATEVPDKVEKGLRFIAGVDNITKRKASGYYGNPIIIMETNLEKLTEIKEFFLNLKKSGLIEKLSSQLHDRVDEDCNFHLRFDKQKAFEEHYQLASGEDAIAVKGKLKIFPTKKEVAILKLKEFLENL